ncbi:MAG: nicotinate (nicotinamide) nucleotide adenylyltransferase [Candidatus Omnitrophica bacterium]|nr:nicotinate (nicotinamide) nucleotide adenylyltransferase [Candidatus Omnitrophota bacterium]
MKIGILGGAFNPPHIGHLVLAQEALDKLNLDKIFFIPTNISPHKDNNIVDGLMRLEMLRLATADNKYFNCLDIEIRRLGPSYTIDTIRELKRAYPDDEFFLIIGSDLANSFSTWKDFQQIKKQVKIVAALRKDYPLLDPADFIPIEITHLEISSSKIRDLIYNNSSARYLLRDEVLSYIKEHNLYSEVK